MSVIEVERPAPPAEPSPSWFAGWWNLGLRVVLLAVIVGAAVIALPSARPGAGTVTGFLADLKADNVSSVRYVGNADEVRWSHDWRHWYRASLENSLPLPKLPPSPDHFVVGTDNAGTGERWVLQALHATGHQGVSYDSTRSSGGAGKLTWANRVPWHALSAWTVAAAGVTFALMLLRREHRWGNRWAWLWMMAATSGLGIVLYLVLEPWPVWQRPSRQRPMPLRPAFLGGAGLLFAIALKPMLALLALLVSAS